MTAERREINPSTYLLPRVSQKTLLQFGFEYLAVDTKNKKPKKKDLGNTVQQLGDENPILFAWLINKTRELYNKELAEKAVIGLGLMIVPLHLEAVKQERQLPRVSQGTIDSFYTQNPFWQEGGEIFKGLSREEVGEDILWKTRQKLEEAAQKAGFVSTPFTRMGEENPILVTFLANMLLDSTRRGFKGFDEAIAAWSGALIGYALLRQQAEVDWLNSKF